MKLKHLVAGAATVGLVALAGPAFAAGPPYTVAVGGSTAAGTHNITAASTGAVKFSAKNNAGTVINMDCDSVSGTGVVTSGTRTATQINPVATITSTTFVGCQIPGGAANVAQNGIWNLTGTGTNATPGLETIAGYVGDVDAYVELAANKFICSFTVTGIAEGEFDEVNQQLVVSETGYDGDLELTLENGSLCLGQLQSGNFADFEATLNINSVDGDVNLS